MDGPTTYREIERKFRVHAMFRMPALQDIAGMGGLSEEPTRNMTAVYYDTADLRLFRWKITLRRREGGPDEGWHLKLPVDDRDDGARDELQLPLSAGKAGRVPEQLADLLTALVRDQPLMPMATLRTERNPLLVQDESGSAVLEIVDDLVSIMDGKNIAARFREIEVEALTPSAADGKLMRDVCDALLAAEAIPGTSSKAASAVGPRAADPPDIPAPQRIYPHDPAAAAIRAHLARHARRFLMQDVRVRRDLPDSVHQMRVAARRLRSGLQAFSPLVDKNWSKHLRTELGWIAKELGHVRDTEVMIDRLNERTEELESREGALARETVQSVLGEEIIDARQHALTAMRSDRYRILLVDLVSGVLEPEFTARAEGSCQDVLPKLVDKAWQSLAQDVAKLHFDGPAHPWHEARIRAKRARYATEAVQPVFGKPVRRLTSALSEVTELLGDHQDAHVAQNTLADLSKRSNLDGEAGFALGLLYALEIEYELSLRSQFRRLWPHTVKAKKQTKLGDA